MTLINIDFSSNCILSKELKLLYCRVARILRVCSSYIVRSGCQAIRQREVALNFRLLAALGHAKYMSMYKHVQNVIFHMDSGRFMSQMPPTNWILLFITLNYTVFCHCQTSYALSTAFCRRNRFGLMTVPGRGKPSTSDSSRLVRSVANEIQTA